ncbi:cupin domain-containing protein [Actinoplanes sp. NPDC048796]|uniref:cupin domain-containing protein n=1 Tax=Actinoplanes sp. NPDC048796 TaxID=3155640 RepID=UPI0033C3A925
MATAAARKIAARDVAPTTRQGGEIRVLLSPRTVDATDGFGGTLTLAPGEYVAEQYHPYSDKFLYLVRGVLELTVDGEKIRLAPDEALMVRRGQRHRFVNPGGDEALAVFHVSPLAPRPDLGHVDTEPVPNPAGELPRVGGPR